MERVAKLYRAKLVSEHELNQAKGNVELRRAELEGDPVEVSRVRLRQAVEQLERISKLHQEKLASETEYRDAKTAVDALRLELEGRKGAAAPRPLPTDPAPLTRE